MSSFELSSVPPAVSVIIPTYNCARMVTRAVESVLGQTYSNYEIFVVDDGSTDNTPSVLAQYEGRITYIRQENRGRSAARNHGLCHSSRPYVVFLDSDDVLLPNMLTVQVAYMERHPEMAFVHGYALLASADGQVSSPPVLMGAPLDSRLSPFASLLMGTPVLIHTTLVRRSCLDAVGGFDEALSVGEDWDLWLRLTAQYQVGFNPQPVAVYSVNVAEYVSKLGQYQVQQAIPRMIEHAFTYLPPNSPLLGLKPRAVARAHVQWGACVEHALGQKERALAHIQAALAICPRLASDIEIVPRGVVQFATWSQCDGEAFIRSFFRDMSPSITGWDHLESTALALHCLKRAQLAAYQRRYVTMTRYILRAVFIRPAVLGWAGRLSVSRLWNQLSNH